LLGSSTEAEHGLPRVIIIIALTCFLVVGAAATSLLGRDGEPVVRVQIAPTDANPVSNREAKRDRLAVVAAATASLEPPTATLSDPIRQAIASSTPADIEPPKVAAPAATPPASPRPKLVVKPAPQKSYALLSDAQIAGIKERLKLSSDQESYWPAVESALRAVARKIHTTRQTDPNATGAPIDPDAAEVQQLKSAAMPLLFQLREDQKQEVRTLARLIGLEKVASQI
jgi:hypothetical protein